MTFDWILFASIIPLSAAVNRALLLFIVLNTRIAEAGPKVNTSPRQTLDLKYLLIVNGYLLIFVAACLAATNAYLNPEITAIGGAASIIAGWFAGIFASFGWLAAETKLGYLQW